LGFIYYSNKNFQEAKNNFENAYKNFSFTVIPETTQIIDFPLLAERLADSCEKLKMIPEAKKYYNAAKEIYGKKKNSIKVA
jgi:hypothetical protein